MVGPRLYHYLDVPGQHTLEVYERNGGYQALKKALSMDRATLVDQVKAAAIRGRGGAGFPMGNKWGTIPPGSTTIYITCNADESEPGTCSNREVLERDPHQLIESMIICAYALEHVRTCYIYIRGEYRLGAERLNQAIQDARAQGYLGDNIMGTGFNLDIWVFRGAGAYICGEETALIESIEGKRGQPRLRPPYFPTVMGITNKPTVVNNVETIINIIPVVLYGADGYKAYGTEKSPGTKLYCMSGHIKKPGVYEAPFTVTLRQLIWDFAGGMLNDRKFKTLIPGGASFQWFTEEQLDTVMGFDEVRAAGSNLGSTGIMVMDETTCVVDAALNLVHFFAHESCGKCTPCREGTRWLEQIIWRIEHGQGRAGEVDQLLDITDNMDGKCFCLLGESAIVPVRSSISLFREEWDHHVTHKNCMVQRDYRMSSTAQPH
ncbi:MAG: NADH-quinone oxidoreductase subunit NuoF [Armatimonadetes bacterium]|nr:NADH-quinone oxidoreductase subunit NuoF [Armatimonadota bacterium]